MILFIACSLVYVGFFIWVTAHWQRIESLTLDIENDVSISILIPVRNEEGNIQRLLSDLEKLDFPKNRFEVIFIDDHSTDATATLLTRCLPSCTFASQVIDLKDYFKSGKKEAITVGVGLARFDYILTTDADCSLPPEWVSAFASAYVQYDAVMLTGPVRMTGEGLFEQLQAHEFAGLIGIGAATLHSGNPSMCNGANLSYTREAFRQVNGYEGNTDIPSGDDEFLLQKIYKLHPERVTFLKNTKVVITTPAKSSLRDLINQRIRWSSKWRFHKSRFIRIMAILTFVNYLMFVYGLVVSVIMMSFPLFLIVLAVRWLSVFTFTFFVKRFLLLDNQPAVTLLAEIIYPFFVIFLGLASIFGKYSWKGRHYT